MPDEAPDRTLAGAETGRTLLMSVGARTPGFQVLVNPGHLLGYHREGTRGGEPQPGFSSHHQRQPACSRRLGRI